MEQTKSIKSVTAYLKSFYGCNSISDKDNDIIAPRNFNVQKALLFLPDAIGNQIWNLKPEWYERVVALAPEVIDVKASFPSVTPVCFASMFTGLDPAEHGITRYEKPVLKVETVFDILAKAGKRIALVAVKDCSMEYHFSRKGYDILFHAE